MKGLRSLSHVWNEEALKVLPNRVRVKVLSLHRLHEGGLDGMKQVKDYAQSSLMGRRFPHWAIDLQIPVTAGVDVNDVWWREKIEAFSRTQEGEMKEKKFLEDLAWLFNDHDHSLVTTLVLPVNLVPARTCKMLEVVLGGLGENLSRLDLSLSGIWNWDQPTPFD